MPPLTPSSAWGGSPRAPWTRDSLTWRAWRSRQEQLRTLIRRAANEAEPWLLALASRAEQPIARITADLDADPDLLIDEIAALRLQWARREADRVRDLKLRDRHPILRKYAASHDAAERLVAVLATPPPRTRREDDDL